MRNFALLLFLLIFGGCVSLNTLSFGLLGDDEKTQILSKECADKNAVSCNNLAYEYANNKDFSNASEFYKRACELNLATACANLGQIYEKGLNGETDINMALSLYTLACENNDGVGCYNIALATYQNAPSDKKAIALKKSIILLNKSCKLEYKQACVLINELKKSD